MPAGPARRWGWHRLQPEWAERVVVAAQVRPAELVVDLGAGTGAVTVALRAAGARVIAVELHPARSERLRQRFAADAGVQLVSTDLLRWRLPTRPFRVVSNPPYALTAQLLRRLLRNRWMYAADLVLQPAVVRRSVERYDGRSGWQASTGLRLPRSAFVPSPPRGSAVLVLRRGRR